jgi:hypothetical protein
LRSFIILVPMAVLYIGLEIFYVRRDRKGRKVRRGLLRPDLATFVVVFLFVNFVSPNTMWLPPEAVTTRDNVTHVGYVLTSDDERMLMMLDRDRSLLELKATNVKTRLPCRLQESSRPVISYLYQEKAPKIRKCPKSK